MQKSDPVIEPSAATAAQIVGAARPTRVRYGVLAYCITMALVLYLDRMAISVALPAIARDLDLEIKRVADAVAVFFWSYALFQIPAGWLGDRWGGRRALTLYVVAWSLAIAGMGLAAGLASLVATRALLGVGQAGAYATTASFLRRWIPFASRGVANSAVSLGGRAGGVLAPFVTSVLMVAAGAAGFSSGQWRPVFIAYGVVGLVWAGLFWRWFRDEPRLHPQCNALEVALIQGDEPASEHTTTARGPIPVLAMATNPSLLFLCVANVAINVGWIFVGTLLPTYLIKIHQWSVFDAGVATSCVAGAGMAGCLAGGYATDFFVHRFGLGWGRRLPGLISYGGAASLYMVCFLLEDVSAIVAVLILASFMGDFALGALWAIYQDIGGPWAGTVLGVANMCGNFGAAAAASIVPRLAEHWGWRSTFLLSVVAYSVGAATWALVDPKRTVLRNASPDARSGA